MKLNELYSKIFNEYEKANYKLGTCNFNDLPERGIYIFFDENEDKVYDGKLPRIVRIGTHALTESSETTLATRLKQHRGNAGNLNGNHRGSVFRKHVGSSIIIRDDLDATYPLWNKGSCLGSALRTANAPKWTKDELKKNEKPLEELVSEYIRNLPFIVFSVENAKDRASLEKEYIEILSKGKISVSTNWLGNFSNREEISSSGLWNVDFVI